jgi:riboflavin kinase/FMN adenylyltransferase
LWLDVTDLAAPLGGAIAIGNFDGVHLGHRAVVDHLRRSGLRASVLVPDPHPLTVLGHPQPLLTAMPLRGRLLRAAGVESVVRLPFDRQTADMDADSFVQEIILGRLGPRHVVVGFNFTYGRGASGNVDSLQAALGEAGVLLDVVAPTLWDGQVVSSSRIRRSLGEGDLALAEAMLGRPHLVPGVVRAGRGRGREIGFPTANVATAPTLALPAEGVYAVRCRVGDRVFDGVANLGPQPTFDQGESLLEVHLFEFGGDLYGREVEVAFAARLRGQLRFDGPGALARQIAQDAAAAKEMLGVAVRGWDMLGWPG